MNKKELFDALDDFLNSCWQPWQMSKPSKKNLKSVVEENTALRLENDKLKRALE